MNQKMQVEIWSDIMCPFCYIGKRKFENALALFPNPEDIEITWKSFQLSPDMVTSPEKSIHQFLSEHKGITTEQAKKMNGQVTDMAKQVELDYDFDKAIPANSFKAHQFSHLALKHSVQNAAEEALFKAYFTEGKNIDDIETLVQIGLTLGIDAAETRTALLGNLFAQEVEEDIYEARQLGVKGVPFFVYNRKYAVSGAQDVSVFAKTLSQAFSEWKNAPTTGTLETSEGETCDIDGNC